MCPLSSPPKDIQHGGQCSCQSSPNGSSPLQQDLSCFNKLICQSDILSPESQILWQFSSNRWECSSWLSHSGSLDYPAGSSFQIRHKTSLQNRSGADKTHHSTSIPPSQRAPIGGCLFLRVIYHDRKHFRKRPQLFCQRLPTLLDWPLGNDEKSIFTGLDIGKEGSKLSAAILALTVILW